jgi:predicted O-methyltransferase YrrM
MTGNGAFDLIFLDSERSEYVRWWPDIKRVLQRGGVLVVDNATSHPGELGHARQVRLERARKRCSSCVCGTGTRREVPLHGCRSHVADVSHVGVAVVL